MPFWGACADNSDSCATHIPNRTFARPYDSTPFLSHARPEYWLRNVARHPNSFWLPTATDKFYPDFVALLDDGRLLAAEYKGAHLVEGSDAAEKRVVGALWEQQSGSKALFIMVEKTVDGKNMRRQLMEKISAA